MIVAQRRTEWTNIYNYISIFLIEEKMWPGAKSFHLFSYINACVRKKVKAYYFSNRIKKLYEKVYPFKFNGGKRA